MKKSILWWITCLTINLHSSHPLPGQSVAQTVQMGDSCYARESFSTAIYYYQRARFFSPARGRYAIARKIAFAYTKQQEVELAIAYFNFAIDAAPTDSIRWEITFEQTALYLLQDNYKSAYLSLISLPDPMVTPHWEHRKRYYLGVTCIGLEQWEEAEFNLGSLIRDSVGKQALHHLFEHRQQKNIRTARIMSMIVPGSGQMYAGDVRAGINSFFLTGGIAAIGIFSAIEYGWSGSLWTINWFTRYYRGGIREAKESAEKKNRSNKKKMQEQTNLLIQPK